MCKYRYRLWSLVLVMFAVSCGDPLEFRFGQDINGIQFELFDETEGIHPSNAVLRNPRNPFREVVVGDVTKFGIFGSAGNAGAFYAWATKLAVVATGEHQYFTALKLRDIYNANEVPQRDRDTVRRMAIAAFQSVLDDFPDSVTFDFTGTRRTRLATPSYLEIVALDGAPLGDWLLVEDENGELAAVKGGGVDAPRPEPVPPEDDE